MTLVTKAIEILLSASEDYETAKRISEHDNKYGRHEMFDPVYYDEKSHTEIKEALKILMESKKPNP